MDIRSDRQKGMAMWSSEKNTTWIHGQQSGMRSHHRSRNRCTKGAVRAVFDRLEKKLGTYGFLCLFGTLLTDRGSEFGDSDALETGINGIERTNIYYCDPMRSSQKGGVENVHTMLRMEFRFSHFYHAAGGIYFCTGI